MTDLAELVFVPCPGAGHLGSTVEMAKLLVTRDSRLSVSVLIIKFPTEPESNHSGDSSDLERIKFVDLPRDEPKAAADSAPINFFTFFESQKPHVREAVEKIASGSTRMAGFVIDMFCTAMIDVADEFGVPSYVFFTCGAGFFSLVSHLQDNTDREVTTEPGSDIVVPGFVNPVPPRVFPSVLSHKEVGKSFLDNIRKIRQTKGILINTFADLESNAIDCLTGSTGDGFPPVYPVGPVLNLNPGKTHVGYGQTDRAAEILTWLDEQPPSSVVFLCFGSMGSFDKEQVREIATGLERTGFRFLWSLRKPSPMGTVLPGDYADPNEVLPEGFLDRTAQTGKVIGWAPQVSVLAHPAVGGFVSHCGWNSTLESLWFGVPMATWPLYAEQQTNAFVLVKEFGLAVEITLDYKKPMAMQESEKALMVEGEVIERGIKELMKEESEIRERVKEMSQKSRRALLPGGSSYTALSHFINHVLDGVA